MQLDLMEADLYSYVGQWLDGWVMYNVTEKENGDSNLIEAA